MLKQLSRTPWRADVWIHILLASALVGGMWSASGPCRFTLVESARGTHWIGLVGLRAGLDDTENLKILTPPALELRALSRPARKK
jgi:hypothetical protein